MEYRSSRSSTETSPSIWRRSKPTRTAWWSFVTRCEDIAASHGTPPVSESVISVSELTRRFGATTALAAVSLSLPRGAVYGLVGANVACKTTRIKHHLHLLRAQS